MKHRITEKQRIRLSEEETLATFPKYRKSLKLNKVKLSDFKKIKKGTKLNFTFFVSLLNKWKNFTFTFDKIDKKKNTIWIYDKNGLVLHVDKLGQIRRSESSDISPIYWIKTKQNPSSLVKYEKIQPHSNPLLIPGKWYNILIKFPEHETWMTLRFLRTNVIKNYLVFADETFHKGSDIEEELRLSKKMIKYSFGPFDTKPSEYG